MRKPRDREAPSSERPRRFPEFITHRVTNPENGTHCVPNSSRIPSAIPETARC